MTGFRGDFKRGQTKCLSHDLGDLEKILVGLSSSDTCRWDGGGGQVSHGAGGRPLCRGDLERTQSAEDCLVSPAKLV